MNKDIASYINNYIDNFKPYKNGRWCYEDGILMTAIYDLYKVTNDKKYYDFVYNFYDNHIEDDGTIKNYKVDEYNIDNICSGNTLIDLYLDTKQSKFRVAIDTLCSQLRLHPRTKEGSFWHKQIYPNQVWMDGIYMGLVFYAKYAKYFGDGEDILDIKHQLNNLINRLYDNDRQLFTHAYDEARLMQWADKETGKSPNVWSRACGWVAMAMVDIYEVLELNEAKDVLNLLVDGLSKYLDEGMLYQVVDKASFNGNYLETSGSAMLAYAILKAKRIKMADYNNLGNKIFNTILEKKFDGNHLNGICRVAGLDNARRKGSIEYYMSEDVVADEVKGVAPFIMAYSELEAKDGNQ